MPYSGPSDASLPDRIKAMPMERRRQWVGAFNGSYRQCQSDGADDCEGRAFRIANAAIKELDDMEHTEEASGLLRRAWTALKDLFELPEAMGEPAAPAPAENLTPVGMSVFKDTAGNWRWFAWVSNQWRDRDNPPEIIESKAHQEYVDYLDKTGKYPEAWLWHTPGTRWGKADWADFTDGFLVMAGTVDKGMEHVAEGLAADDGLGVSHGFFNRYSNTDAGHIGWYRTFEISPLPLTAAANPWTGMHLLQKEAVMFTPKKREWLKGLLGEERVSELEANTTGIAKALAESGVDWKDAPPDEDEGVQPDGDPTPTAAAEDKGLSIKALTEALAPNFKSITDGIEAIQVKQVATDGRLDTFDARLKALERSEDEKISAAFTARVTPGQTKGYRASEAADTILGDHDGLKEARPAIDPRFLESLKA